jgi:hypothetical protein
MPIIDTRSRFLFEQDVFGATGTALVGDVIDITTVRDIGNGQPLYWNTIWTTALVGATATINIQLVSDAQAAIATDASATVHVQTGVRTIAQSAKNLSYSFLLPLEGLAYERFLGVLVVRATAATTAGKLSSFLSLTPINAWRPYAEATN